jgi:hypothetical protein
MTTDDLRQLFELLSSYAARKPEVAGLARELRSAVAMELRC